MEKVKCAICGSEDYNMVLVAEDYRLHTTNRRFHLVRCQQCGLVYVNPRPKKEELDKFYPRIYYGSQGRIGKVVVKLIHNIKISKIMNFKGNGRILDVGCGDGEFLLHLKERSWDVYGVDTSEISYKLARKKLGKHVYNRELKDCRFPDKYFDVVTLNHVLEHMLNPNEELREVYRVLKHDGILLLSTPNIDSLQFKISREVWFGLDLPRHLYHYSSRTIKDMLKRSGFDVIKTAYPLLDFPLDLFHSLKAKWLNEKSKSLKIVILPLILISSILIKLHPAWRGSVEVAAQKILESHKFSQKGGKDNKADTPDVCQNLTDK